MAEQVDHWLRQNRANRVPRRLVCLDSEARAEKVPGGSRDRFRLAVASLDLLDEQGRQSADTAWLDATGTEQLWAGLAGWTAPRQRTVLYAHRLAYDLRLTEALERLPELGFQPSRIVLGEYSCWARFAKGERVLFLCDSASWLPATLDQVAGDLRLSRRRLPRRDAGDPVWLERCYNDVAVLRAAMLNLMGWLVEDRLGDWRPTGPGQASACFRHRFLPARTVLVHWAPEPRTAERRAAWTGRAEVWQPGKQAGPVSEYDYTAAYCWIAERQHLPVRLLGSVAVRDRGRLLDHTEARDVLYRVKVATEQPTLPCEHEGRIVWPVGEFETVVWDVELRNAVAEGAQVEVEQAWLYEASPVLRPWARWVLAGLGGAPPGDDPLRRRVLKAWSRSLIGRFALRYPSLDLIREEPCSALSSATVWDHDLGRGVREIQVGRQVFEQDGEVEAGSSSPQLMSAVMAHCRVRLWRTMRAAGLDELLYVDTDSLLVTAAGAARVEARLRQQHFPGLRLKGVYRLCDLRAPRNVDLGGERRVAGLPRQAALRPDGVFEAEIWESLPAAIRRRRPPGVFRLERSFRIGQNDYRRRHLDGGGSVPFRLQAGERVE